MGSRYTSIHLKASSFDQVEHYLSTSYQAGLLAEQRQWLEMLQKMVKRNNADLSDERIDQIMQQTCQSFMTPGVCFVQTERFVSIYDENLSYQTVEAQAQMVSKHVEVPVAYTSNFDDDVFLFGVYLRGDIVTRGCILSDNDEDDDRSEEYGICEDDDLDEEDDTDVEYGVQPCKADIQLFLNTMGLYPSETPELPEDDAWEAGKIIEKELGIALDLTEPLPEAYRMLRKAGCFNLYEKK